MKDGLKSISEGRSGKVYFIPKNLSPIGLSDNLNNADSLLFSNE